MAQYFMALALATKQPYSDIVEKWTNRDIETAWSIVEKRSKA